MTVSFIHNLACSLHKHNTFKLKLETHGCLYKWLCQYLILCLKYILCCLLWNYIIAVIFTLKNYFFPLISKHPKIFTLHLVDISLFFEIMILENVVFVTVLPSFCCSCYLFSENWVLLSKQRYPGYVAILGSHSWYFSYISFQRLLRSFKFLLAFVSPIYCNI